MSDETTISAAERDAAVAAARAAEKTRVAALNKLAGAYGATAAELAAAIEGDTTAEAFALALADKAEAKRAADAAQREADAKAAAEADAKRLAALKEEGDVAARVHGAPGAEDEAGELDALVAGVANYLPADRRAPTAK